MATAGFHRLIDPPRSRSSTKPQSGRSAGGHTPADGGGSSPILVYAIRHNRSEAREGFFAVSHRRNTAATPRTQERGRGGGGGREREIRTNARVNAPWEINFRRKRPSYTFRASRFCCGKKLSFTHGTIIIDFLGYLIKTSL